MAQYSRPSSDVDITSWTCSTGSDRYALVDESVANDDTDYIWRSATHVLPTDATMGMSSVTDPVSSSGHILRARARLESAGGATLTCTLSDSGSIITTQDFLMDDTGYATFEYTLSGAEADAIVDYATFKIYVLARDGGGNNVRLTWVELEVPDVAPPTLHQRTLRGHGK